MKEVHPGRATRAAIQSATSTWRAVAKNGRPPIKIAVGHLEKEQTLDDALDEYCQLREQDRSLTASQFCNRYPSYRHSLRRLIDVHDAMEHQPALEEENWPELFSEFLGYEIIHELGVGAIARVYLAAETALGGRLVAIKVSHHGGDEAETLGKLTHPNVVPVFSVKHDENTDMTAVCMPYHGSATLADLLEIGFESGSPPKDARVILDAAREREQVVDFVDGVREGVSLNNAYLSGSYVDGVVRIGIQLAEALAYTHEHGILHRDLKPSNVLLTPSGVPMLLDFNLASDMETGALRLGGTLPYMPPEQIRDVHLQPFEADLSGDPRSDIFSLGVILYELLTGRLPFGDPPAGQSPRRAAEEYLELQQQKLIPIVELNAKVSRTLAKTIERCLSLRVDERPQSANQLAKDLRHHFGALAWFMRYRVVFLLLIAFTLLAITGRIHYSLNEVSDYARHMDDAITALEAEQYNRAIKAFDDAERAEGHETLPILFGRGYCCEQIDRVPIALSELKRATEISRDPLIADCYSHTAATQADYGQALLSYQDVVPQDPNCAMRYVSLAYCKLNFRVPNPANAVLDLDKALDLDPSLQIAYHLRANAKKQSRHPRHNPISNSILDIEAAFRVGPAYAQLHCDAARIYALAAIEDPTFLVQLKTHLHAAVDAGLGRNYLQEQLEEFDPWKTEPWFSESLASCGKNGVSQSPDSLRDRSLLSRTPAEVANWLRHQKLP